MEREYYEAYDDRYSQVHAKGLRWFSNTPSRIVGEILEDFSVPAAAKLLEIGCGEGRDAFFLLERGWDLLATDIAPAAIGFCRAHAPQWAKRFRVLDCIREELEERFDFIYGVAVLHMLVREKDRRGFYRFIARQLTEEGIALICTMGDGTFEICSDIRNAFALQRRMHEQTGQAMLVAGTSCRVIRWDTFLDELEQNGLSVLRSGLTSVEPDFPEMMYAVVKRR